MAGTFTAEDMVISLACAPDVQPDRPVMCLAGCSSGLYRSTSSGVNWVNLYNRLPMRIKLPVTAVAFSPRFWDDHSMFATVAGNVFRSDNAGENWNGVVIDDPLPYISCLALSPDYLRDGTLFVGTLEHGVYKSASRGQQWQPASAGLTDRRVLCMAISRDYRDHSALLCGTDTGIFRSVNGGADWRKTALPCGDVPVLSLAYSTDYTRDRMVYAGTESEGIFASRDGGRSWAALPGALPDGSVDGLYPLTAGWLGALVDNRLYQSSAEGDWTPWNTSKDVDSISAAAVAGDPPVLFTGALGGKFTWIEPDV